VYSLLVSLDYLCPVPCVSTLLVSLDYLCPVPCVYTLLVSLDYPFLIAPSGFSNVYIQYKLPKCIY
jgi:hypothetical protein